MRTPPRRALWTIVAAVAGLACLIAAAVLVRDPGHHTPRALGTVPSSQPTPASRANRTTAAAPAPGTAVPSRTVGHPPTRVQIPRLGIDGSVVPVTVDEAGVLGVPDNPKTLGWWREGARLGGGGTVVIDGHVDSAATGRGTFFRLDQVDLGDSVWVTGADGRVRYSVQARRTYTKSGPGLPPDTFSTIGRPRLVLITCGGQFDGSTHHYEQNIVVYAVPAR